MWNSIARNGIINNTVRLKRFSAILTAPYRDADIRIRKKAGLLAPSALVTGLIGLLLALVMAATGAIVVALFLLGLTAFCGTVLYLMARGRYRLASLQPTVARLPSSL